MPLKFWDEAFLTVVHIINMLPRRVINNETPTEKLLHIKPDYLPFMCLAALVGLTLDHITNAN